MASGSIRRACSDLADGGKVDSSDFHRLYNGFAPNTGGKLTQNAGSERRSAGLDMTFSADKSVSALWAVADPELRAEIERAHNDAARGALEETVLRHCAYTRIRNRDGEIEVLPADISAAMFQHGTSRDNDPQLHTHCVIFNAARTHRDGKYRALHQHPVYTWMKAAGAVYRNTHSPGACKNASASAWNSTARMESSRASQAYPEGPDRALVEAPRGDYRSGPGDGLYGRGQRATGSGGEQDHTGRQVARQ